MRPERPVPSPGEELPPSAEGSRWLSAERVRARLSPELHPVAEQVVASMFLGEEAAEEDFQPPPGGFTIDDVQTVVSAVREVIDEAAAGGASPRSVSGWHERLDREAFRLAGSLVDRGMLDSRQLLEGVSHDIRSPLNSILFLADTLFSGHSGPLNPIQQRQMGVLYTAAVTLVGLVNDLMDAARIGSGSELEVAKATFSMEQVLSDVENLLRPLATHRHVELNFKLETLGPRSGDRQLVSRVLINLVTNAAQAVEDGGTAEVRVTEPDAGWLRCQVRDDGPGDSGPELQRMLEQSSDGGVLRKGPGWTHGLGLRICGRLARAAGGNIFVEAEPGAGTTFTVDLPFPRV